MEMQIEFCQTTLLILYLAQTKGIQNANKSFICDHAPPKNESEKQ